MKQSYLVLGEQSNIAVAPSAKVETCRNGAIDPESSKDYRSTWIQMRGKQKPGSPKPREIDDILQLASFKAKCTTETECRFKANCCLKLPLAESCLWKSCLWWHRCVPTTDLKCVTRTSRVRKWAFCKLVQKCKRNNCRPQVNRLVCSYDVLRPQWQCQDKLMSWTASKCRKTFTLHVSALSKMNQCVHVVRRVFKLLLRDKLFPQGSLSVQALVVHWFEKAYKVCLHTSRCSYCGR